MPVSKPQDIRNIVFLGHGSSGKTTLCEAMLHVAKVTTRFGTVADGTTVFDFADIEKERKHSVDPAMGYVEHEGRLINIIDAPGYPDFIGGAIGALAGADIGIIVISATAGIEINARRLFKMAQEAGLASAIVINKIDGENINLERLVGEIQEAFGQACKPMNLPTGGGKAVVDCFLKDSGDADFGDVASAHTQLIESVIEVDEAMMEAYLGGETISTEKLIGTLDKAMAARTVIPILFTAAKIAVGVKELMDAIVKYFPSPCDLKPRTVRNDTNPDAPEVAIACDPSKPFVGQAFKTTTDPFVGKLAWVRILQGTVLPETVYLLRDEKKGTKIAHIFKLQGKDPHEIKQAIAGDIIALAKVEDIKTGNVLHVDPHPMFMAMPPSPTPMYSLAVTTKSRGDEQKISEALSRLAEEDHTFISTRESQTGETVISGIGDLHLRIMLTKMKSRFDMDVDTKPPKIPYKETIAAKADGHYRHKKQTGGAGQFGEVYLRVEPLERGGGFDFVDELFGESIPRQYLPAIRKGVDEVMQRGAIAGFPMQDIRVAITDGKYHPVDSKEIAFKTAGKFAFIDAIQKAHPVLLEPIVVMEITVPSHFMGDIASDLSGRRGRILGQDMLPGNMITVKAQAPLSEVMQYNSQLRSVTGGQGSYTMEFSHYEPVPAMVQQQIVANAAKAKEEEHDK
jgi:elongation factor G